jgi:hypothetical protein
VRSDRRYPVTYPHNGANDMNAYTILELVAAALVAVVVFTHAIPALI